MNTENLKNKKIPVLPLRDLVIYPKMVISIFVVRNKSIKSIKSAINSNKKIILITQKNGIIEDPKIKDFFSIGTLSSILQVFSLPNGSLKVLVEGLYCVCINKIINYNNYYVAYYNKLHLIDINKNKKNILIRILLNQFKKYVFLSKIISIESLNILNKIKDSINLIYTISGYINVSFIKKQLILEKNNILDKIKYVIYLIELELDFINTENKIRDRIKNQIENSQREYYLNEQIKAIKKEIGSSYNDINDIKLLSNKINLIKKPKEIKNKLLIELNKLKTMTLMSSEYNVTRSYIDWIISIPWSKKTKIKKNIIKSEEILNKEHYGLEKIKERILEFIAVQNRSNKLKGPILCFLGPPGVGKTSLGKSIAKAIGRKYIHMSLGGINDEAEIRGHRRTYIGAMPGKIIQKITKIGVKNPLFLLDEIDKISCTYKGDPSSALLEVLDNEYNKSFEDNYLEVEYDLSEVMFIATANSMNIPSPLLDRMEIIRISGYTEKEKVNIARKHLIPKQIKENSLKKNELNICDFSILEIIRRYTYESGVRGLEREISKICRKLIKYYLLNKKNKKIIINKKNLENYLGQKKFDYGKKENKNYIGQVNGLAWTDVGGELLTIESICIIGKGKLEYTGSLGSIMKESIKISLTIVRSLSSILNINNNFYKNYDIHVHIPSASIPKEGPSAGIAICTAIISSLTNNPIKSNVAMTGEITLSGKILPIGGLKEKLLAANRGGIKKVLIPYKNKKDLKYIPYEIYENLNIYPVKIIHDVLKLSLQNFPFNNTIIK